MSVVKPFIRFSCVHFGLLMACIALGCGSEDYERRLNETKLYYNELQRIETNLASKWTDGRVVDSMRVPKQFQAIPAPVPVANDQGKVEMPAVDLRQPDFINLIFPTETLVGAWECPFEIVASGNTETRKGYIYIISNYWMFAAEEPAHALTFTGAMIQLIGDALEEHLPQDKLENPEIKKLPKPGGYFPSNAYSVFEFKPKPITLRETTVPYDFTAYARQNGNIQCMILTAFPEDISSKEKLGERVPMMLEHFAFTKNEPRPGQNANAAGPAQGPAPAAGF